MRRRRGEREGKKPNREKAFTLNWYINNELRRTYSNIMWNRARSLLLYCNNNNNNNVWSRCSPCFTAYCSPQCVWLAIRYTRCEELANLFASLHRSPSFAWKKYKHTQHTHTHTQQHRAIQCSIFNAHTKRTYIAFNMYKLASCVYCAEWYCGTESVALCEQQSP